MSETNSTDSTGADIPRLRTWLGMAAAGLTPVIITGTVWYATLTDTPAQSAAVPPVAEASVDRGPAPVLVPVVSPQTLASLVEATTWTTVSGAPVDENRQAGTDGLVAHNPHPVAVFDHPGGQPIARLPERQGASDTWLPVIDSQPGWIRVLLPARPNGSTGWIDATAVQLARSDVQIRVQVAAMTIEVWRGGTMAGRWRTSPGKADTPTPTGRTFILAAIRDNQQTYSPVIAPLGAHSEVLDSFSGGPGTIAIHTWPTDSVIGTAASHGCIRIPNEAMTVVLQAPAGSLVLITP